MELLLQKFGIALKVKNNIFYIWIILFFLCQIGHLIKKAGINEEEEKKLRMEEHKKIKKKTQNQESEKALSKFEEEFKNNL